MFIKIPDVHSSSYSSRQEAIHKFTRVVLEQVSFNVDMVQVACGMYLRVDVELWAVSGLGTQ